MIESPDNKTERHQVDFLRTGALRVAIMTPNQQLPVDWNAVADTFCEAWTSPVGKPDFDTLANMYAHDSDIVIYDSLPPSMDLVGLRQCEHRFMMG